MASTKKRCYLYLCRRKRQESHRFLLILLIAFFNIKAPSPQSLKSKYQITIKYLIFYRVIKAAYSYYNVSTTVSISDLINDALIVAYNEGFDVFNALDIMDNLVFLQVDKKYNFI